MTELEAGGLSARLAPYASTIVAWFVAQVGNVGIMLVQFLLTVVVAAVLYTCGETAAGGVRQFARRLAGAPADALLHLARAGRARGGPWRGRDGVDPSLLVGGIGIMNIMLVSVTERSREIGLRMAVGARPRDIQLQFLVEALTLAMAGGLVGVGLGLLAAWRLAAAFGWPVLFRPDVVVIAVGFSGLVGVGFCFWPALKASGLDPIQALRFE